MLVGILILLLIVVVFLAAFAVQNTGVLTIEFFNVIITGAPVYAVVVVSAALGALITGLVALWSWARRSLHGRAAQHRLAEQEMANRELSSQVSTLAAERDGLAHKLEQVMAERDDLRFRVDAMESELSRPGRLEEPQSESPDEQPSVTETDTDTSDEATEEPDRDGSKGWWPLR